MDITTLLLIGTGATFVCLLSFRKNKAVKGFMIFMLIMFVLGLVVTYLV